MRGYCAAESVVSGALTIADQLYYAGIPADAKLTIRECGIETYEVSAQLMTCAYSQYCHCFVCVKSWAEHIHQGMAASLSDTEVSQMEEVRD
jgi:hypothetical protein